MFEASPKIEAYNPNYTKPGGDVKVYNFSCKTFIKAQRLINKDLLYLFNKIFEEKLKFDAAPKIDAKNDKYVKPGGDVKVLIFLSLISNSFEMVPFFS